MPLEASGKRCAKKSISFITIEVITVRRAAASARRERTKLHLITVLDRMAERSKCDEIGAGRKFGPGEEEK